MSTLLSIDPGTRGCGAALFSDSVLLGAQYIENPIGEGAGPREAASLAIAVVSWATKLHGVREPKQLALEWPQTYGGRSKVGDTNDLFMLSAVDGALAALCPSAAVTKYLPRAWKGGIQKPENVKGEDYEDYAITVRMRAELSSDENARVVFPDATLTRAYGKLTKAKTAVKLSWDVADAVCVGLKHLGRFEKKRVFHLA